MKKLEIKEFFKKIKIKKIKLPTISQIKLETGWLVTFWQKTVSLYFSVKTILLMDQVRRRKVGKVLAVLAILVSLVILYAGKSVYIFRDSLPSNKTLHSIVATGQTIGRYIPFPIAFVNFDFITFNDYARMKDYVHHFYAATQQTDVDYNNVDRQIIDQLVQDRLVAREALKYHLKVTDADRAVVIDQIASQNGGKENVDKVLNDYYGINLKSFEKLINTQLLRDKLSEKVVTKLTVSHILIRVDASATDDVAATAKTKADGILAEIRSGTITFADSARKNSEDVSSAENGGLLDPFSRGDMVPTFEATAFATKVGEISDPVRTDFGWHIIKVEARTGIVDEKFADWLDGIKQKLQKKHLILNFYEI